jgi:hypothetical protein
MVLRTASNNQQAIHCPLRIIGTTPGLWICIAVSFSSLVGQPSAFSRPPVVFPLLYVVLERRRGERGGERVGGESLIFSVFLDSARPAAT